MVLVSVCAAETLIRETFAQQLQLPRESALLATNPLTSFPRFMAQGRKLPSPPVSSLPVTKQRAAAKIIVVITKICRF